MNHFESGVSITVWLLHLINEAADALNAAASSLNLV